RILDVLSPVVSNVNFTDTTVFSVVGKAHFPVIIPGDTCWIQGADVLLDGNPTGIQTDFQGRYALGIQELGTHSISVSYNHHTFNPPEYTLNITDNFFNQDFINTSTDTLQVKVKGGCGNIIADSAAFTVRSLDPGNCFFQSYTT